MEKNYINTTTANLDDTTLRCINVLRTLLATQDEVLSFLDKEGILDSKEGETFADSMGSAIQSFSGILGDSLYHKIVNRNIA